MGDAQPNGEESRVVAQHLLKSMRVPLHGVLRFATINVRSLRHKLDEVALVLDSNSIDLIVLTDTGLEPWLELAAINGYRLVARVDRREGSQGQGGGVVVFAKCGLVCHWIPTDNPLSLLVRTRSLFVWCVSVHPSSSVSERVSLFDDFRLYSSRPTLILNCPYADWDLMTVAGPGCREWSTFFATLRSDRYTQLVRGPTHVYGNLLDVALTNVRSCVLLSDSLSTFPVATDHSLVVCAVSPTAVRVISSLPNRNFYKCNYDEMSCHVRDEISLSVIPCADVWQAYSVLESVLQKAIDICVPLKRHIGVSTSCRGTGVCCVRFTVCMHLLVSTRSALPPIFDMFLVATRVLLSFVKHVCSLSTLFRVIPVAPALLHTCAAVLIRVVCLL
eukprot:GHVN01077276.1.p1 GENE.GHVN01077276.1~~GHVN01077276.1.p1  ORF type:complete len:389 (+),score=19.93 GHVN01077276.1:266-1432(+)